MENWTATRVRTEAVSEDAGSRLPQPAGTPNALRPSDGCIDWPAAWVNVDDDHELFVELAGLFLTDLPQQMQNIHRAAEAKQMEELARLAHRMKGSVANFAAKATHAAALQLEMTARRADFGHLPFALAALENETERLKNALLEWTRQPRRR